MLRRFRPLTVYSTTDLVLVSETSHTKHPQVRSVSTTNHYFNGLVDVEASVHLGVCMVYVDGVGGLCAEIFHETNITSYALNSCPEPNALNEFFRVNKTL